jgi:2-polyprenyl-6-methoxyphenol hydroxylase-like FAD-dependent oxidoreductase
MDLEDQARAAHIEGADEGTVRWPRDEAGPPLGPPHLHAWDGQAQPQGERRLPLELAVVRTTVDRTRAHSDEESLVLQGLQRQLAQATAWWRPANRRRRSGLKRRIAQRQQVLTRLVEYLRQAEEQVSERRQILDRAAAAAQAGQGRNWELDDPSLDLPRRREQADATRAVEDSALGAGPDDATPRQRAPAATRTDLDVRVGSPEPAREPVTRTLHRPMARAGMNDLSIAIVGGSITGPVLCLLLRQAGFNDVRIYEATPRAVPQAGGVIGLDHTSLGVLDTIGVPQNEIIPFPSERVVSVKVADRRQVRRVETLYLGRNTTWTLAHHALTQRLPADSLRSGVRLTGLEAGDDGRAVLQFAGGERATADLVAFADGRKSTGRKLLDPERPLHYAGYVAHRGQLDDGPPELRDTRRYEPGGTQFIVFPIRQPGEEGIGTDWTFFLNATAEQFRMHFGADPTNRTFVLPQHVSAEARSHVDAMATKLLTPEAAELVLRTTRRMAVPILDIAPPTRMVYPVGSSHAVLLGDALAPVRPHTARGANNGIDQAAALATALASYRNDGVDLDVTLSAWQERSLPLVNEALERGPELGQALGLGL